MDGFTTSRALVVGIDAYGSRIPPLKTAVRDARSLARCLADDHGFDVVRLQDASATRAGIFAALDRLASSAAADDRVVFYFAGHGYAHGEGADGPQGYLLPADADRADPDSWLPSAALRAALDRLPCKHLLVVLDCCFAGAFRWASTRGFLQTQRLCEAQFNRYRDGKAWHVLTSASHEQEAQDAAPEPLAFRDNRGAHGGGDRSTRTGQKGAHSPFAQALLEGLRGAADAPGARFEPDGVITVTELLQYIEWTFDTAYRGTAAQHQLPGLWPLDPANTGQFVFEVPGSQATRRPDPPLTDENNPWRGLRNYTGEDRQLLFGRTRVVDALESRLRESTGGMLAVLGASGTGKSSVVQAGVLPRLADVDADADADAEADASDERPWKVLGPHRPGAEPDRLVERILDEQARADGDEGPVLVALDQLEEVFTLCSAPERRDRFFAGLRTLLERPRSHLLVAIRSDFLPQLDAAARRHGLDPERYFVPQFTPEEYREVIEGPARVRAVYLEPVTLVDDLVAEVVAMPGALPMLSFTLSEMYRRLQRRWAAGDTGRALTRADHEAVGGVSGSLQNRASRLLESADEPTRRSLRHLFLRLVSLEGGRPARRRVSRRELRFDDPAEQARNDIVLGEMIEARLLVAGAVVPAGGGDPSGEVTHYEPAHDTLVLAWQPVADWLAEVRETFEIHRALWREADGWDQDHGEERDLRLWADDPRIALIPPRVDGHDWRNAVERSFCEASERREQEEAQARERRRREREERLHERGQEGRDARRRSWLLVAAAVTLPLFVAFLAWLAAWLAARAEDRAVEVADLAQMAEVYRQADDPVMKAQALGSVERPDRVSDWYAEAMTTLGELSSSRWVHPWTASIEVERLLLPGSGDLILLVGSDAIEVWPRSGEGERVLLRANGPLEGIDLLPSPDGRWVAAHTPGAGVDLWATSGPGESTLVPGSEQVAELRFTPDGTQLLALTDAGELRVWTLGGAPVLQQPGIPDVVGPLSFGEGSHHLFSVQNPGSDDGRASIRMWEGPDHDLESARDLVGPPGVEVGRWLAAGSAVVATGDGDGVWQWRATGPEPTRVALPEYSRLLGLSPDGRRVLVRVEAVVVAYDLEEDQPPVRFDDPDTNRVWFADDGRRIFSTGFRCRSWSADGSDRSTLPADFPCTASGDLSWALTDDGRVQHWSPDGPPAPSYVPHEGYLGPMRSEGGDGQPTEVVDAWPPIAFSPDGQWLATATSDHAVRVCPTLGDAGCTMLQGHRDAIESVSFGPGGDAVLTVSADGSARLWSVGDGETLLEYAPSSTTVGSVALGPDGTLAVVEVDRNAYRRWRRIGESDLDRESIDLSSAEGASADPDPCEIESAVQRRDVARVSCSLVDVATAEVIASVRPRSSGLACTSTDEVSSPAPDVQFTKRGTILLTGGYLGWEEWRWLSSGAGDDPALVADSDDTTLWSLALHRLDRLYRYPNSRIAYSSAGVPETALAAYALRSRGAMGSIQTESRAVGPDRIGGAWGYNADRWLWTRPVDLSPRWKTKGIARGARLTTFSPDGSRMLTVRGATAHVWAADLSGEPAEFEHPSPVVAGAFSADASRLACVCEDGRVWVWPLGASWWKDALARGEGVTWPVEGL